MLKKPATIVTYTKIIFMFNDSPIFADVYFPALRHFHTMCLTKGFSQCHYHIATIMVYTVQATNIHPPSPASFRFILRSSPISLWIFPAGICGRIKESVEMGIMVRFLSKIAVSSSRLTFKGFSMCTNADLHPFFRVFIDAEGSFLRFGLLDYVICI